MKKLGRKQRSSRLRNALARSATVAGALALGVLLGAAAREEPPKVDAISALNEGNRLYRSGRLAEAVEAYRKGYSPAAPNPTLLYNLGTALHHLDRLPEAILWYRRAQPASDDPWLEENLWLARRTLGSQVLPAAGAMGWLERHGNALRWGGTIAAWLGLIAMIALPRLPLWTFVPVAVVAIVLYGAAVFGDRWGPHAAVLLEDCPTTGGSIPSGTEVWVRRTDREQWEIATGGPAVVACSEDSLALVFPDA